MLVDIVEGVADLMVGMEVRRCPMKTSSRIHGTADAEAIVLADEGLSIQERGRHPAGPYAVATDLADCPVTGTTLLLDMAFSGRA